MTNATLNPGNHPVLRLDDAPGYDWEKLKAQWVVGDPDTPEDWHGVYYETKARIAHWIKPTRVVEIGVRAGYSALAFHMGHPYSEFYGLDMDEGGWGGVAGYTTIAEKQLDRIAIREYTLSVQDSQTLKSLPPEGQKADLFHVDGDHTPRGCAHDILLALNSGARYIVVDDYDYSTHVAEGADWAIQKLSLTAWYAGDGGYRGNVVIEGRGLDVERLTRGVVT
jgi:predicted O-methyltransferase YrrM